MDRDIQFLQTAAAAVNAAADGLRDDNDRADFQQGLDELEREEKIMQALMRVAAAGLKDEADTLAAECGLLSVWRAPIKVRRAIEPRADGLPF